MKETDLRDLLPVERRLTPARRRDMEERLMEHIEHDVEGGRRRYRLVVGAVAAVLLLVAGILAVSLGGDEPDSTGTAEEGGQEQPRPGVRWAPVPEEADAALARYAEYGSPTGVPYVTGSDVGCVPPTGSTSLFVEGELSPEMTSLGGQLMRKPLDQALTAEDFVDVCTNAEMVDAWVGPNGTDEEAAVFAPEDATACAAGTTEYPGPVVALGGLTCEDLVDAGFDSPRPMTEDDLAVLNRMRAIDIAAMAMPETCVTRDGAEAWIEALIAEEELGLEVTVPTDEELVQGAADYFGAEGVDPAGLCFYGIINWGTEPISAAVNALPPDPNSDYGPPLPITP